MGVSFDAEWQLASRIECGRLPSTNAFLSTATMRFRLNFTFSYCHEEGTPIARFFGALNRFSIHLTIALAGESPAPIVYPFQPSPQYSMDLHSLHISILLVCSWIPPSSSSPILTATNTAVTSQQPCFHLSIPRFPDLSLSCVFLYDCGPAGPLMWSVLGHSFPHRMDG